MAHVARWSGIGAALLLHLLASAIVAAAAGAAGLEGVEAEEQCLMQGGLPREKVQGHVAALASAQEACFSVHLGVDPAAVPVNKESVVSYGHGFIRVNATSVFLEVGWQVPGVSLTNPVIGLHIHKGSCKQNGPILVGFCGQSPLPPFGGTCSQGTALASYQVMGQPCDATGSGSPCANTDGTATIQEAAAMLLAGKNPSKDFYLNLHTAFSFEKTDGKALGLIRGPLVKLPCSSR